MLFKIMFIQADFEINNRMITYVFYLLCRALNKPRFVVQSAGVDVNVNVAVEQTEQSDSPDSAVSSQDSPQISEPTSTVDKTKQRSRPVRKSDMPPVKDEELVPGASFTGK
ncbi:hypothetical protein Tco_0668535, partial [Tanacetum coccineum]